MIQANLIDKVIIMEILNFIIGFALGSIGTWLSIQLYRQNLRIEMSDKRKHGYTITNHSQRPIPIESVKLQIRKHGEGFKEAGHIDIIGISLPGPLAPESSFEAYFSDLEQAIDTVWADEYRLELITQIGKIFRSKTQRNIHRQHVQR